MKTHGLSKHPIYRVWINMKARCLNANHRDYRHYGGRGITICNRWVQSFENFRDDMLSGWVSGLWIERIDNERNYTPKNCCWTSRSEQMKNRRPIPRENHPMYGKKHSVASKQKMSIAHQDIKHSEEQKAKISASVKLSWAKRRK